MNLRRVVLMLLVFLLVAAAPAQRINLDVQGASLYKEFGQIVEGSGLNVALDTSVPDSRITLYVQNASPLEALRALEQAANLREVQRGTMLVLVSVKSDASVPQQMHSVRLLVPTGAAVMLAQSLQQSLQGSYVSAPDSHTLVVTGTDEAVKQARDIVNQAVGDGYGLQSFEINNMRASDALQRLNRLGIVSLNAPVMADDARHLLVVGGDRQYRDEVGRALAMVDVAPPQVTYQVEVLDVTPMNEQSNRGILWGQPLQQLNGQVMINPGSAVTTFLNKTISLGAQINELVSSGHARVLAQPRIAVMNGEIGKLQIGATYPITQQNGGLVGGGTTQFYQVGIILNMGAQIGANGDVTTDLSATYSDISSYDPFSHQPIIGTRQVSSVVTIHDGQSMVLGGLYNDVDSDVLTKVPWLGDIPVLGQFFRNRQRTHTRDEIVFVMTPKIGLESGAVTQ